MRIRKEYNHKEGKSQKMMSFRIDLDAVAILEQAANKGRMVNQLIMEHGRDWLRRQTEQQQDDDPATHDGHDTQA